MLRLYNIFSFSKTHKLLFFDRRIFLHTLLFLFKRFAIFYLVALFSTSSDAQDPPKPDGIDKLIVHTESVQDYTPAAGKVSLINNDYPLTPWVDTTDSEGDATFHFNVTGTDDHEAAKSKPLYPNPSKGQVYSSFTEEGIAQLIDMTGRVLMSRKVAGGEQIDFKVAPGIYNYLYIESDGDRSNQKIVVDADALTFNFIHQETPAKLKSVSSAMYTLRFEDLEEQPTKQNYETTERPLDLAGIPIVDGTANAEFRVNYSIKHDTIRVNVLGGLEASFSTPAHDALDLNDGKGEATFSERYDANKGKNYGIAITGDEDWSEPLIRVAPFNTNGTIAINDTLIHTYRGLGAAPSATTLDFVVAQDTIASTTAIADAYFVGFKRKALNIPLEIHARKGQQHRIVNATFQPGPNVNDIDFGAILNNIWLYDNNSSPQGMQVKVWDTGTAVMSATVDANGDYLTNTISRVLPFVADSIVATYSGYNKFRETAVTWTVAGGMLREIDLTPATNPLETFYVDAGTTTRNASIVIKDGTATVATLTGRRQRLRLGKKHRLATRDRKRPDTAVQRTKRRRRERNESRRRRRRTRQHCVPPERALQFHCHGGFGSELGPQRRNRDRKRQRSARSTYELACLHAFRNGDKR